MVTEDTVAVADVEVVLDEELLLQPARASAETAATAIDQVRTRGMRDPFGGGVVGARWPGPDGAARCACTSTRQARR
jgi:hypothetical protein